MVSIGDSKKAGSPINHKDIGILIGEYNQKKERERERKRTVSRIIYTAHVNCLAFLKTALS